MAQRYYPQEPHIQYDDCLYDEECCDELQEPAPNVNMNEVFEEIREHYDTISSDDITIAEDECDLLLTVAESPEDAASSAIGEAIEQLGGKAKDKSCGACAKPRRADTVSSFKKGQHISMPGTISTKYIKPKRELKNAYTHHAIVKEIKNTTGTKIELVLIHFNKIENKGKVEVFETTENYDLKEKEIYIIDYIYPRYDPDEIVRRAESVLQGKKGNFKSYNPLTKNCEHFATWCVVGEGESFQVQGIKEQIAVGIQRIFGAGSNIAKGILRLLFISADEIVSGLGKVAPDIALGATSGLYLIYCIVKTVLHVKDYKEGTLCKSCLKSKLLDLWLSFGAFGITSALTFIILNFALPLIAPAIGIPIMILLILLSVAFQWSVPKIRRALQGPFTVDKTKVATLSQLTIGDAVTFTFGPTKIVTDVKFGNDTPSKGVIRVVHYSMPSFFQKRVIEEDIQVDLSTKSLYVYDCSPLNTYSSQIVLSRIRSRIGETKWSMTSNRSDHLCYWAKICDESDSREEEIQEMSYQTQSPEMSSLFVEEKEVHLIDEIRVGDVIKSSEIGFFRDSGIVIALKHLDRDNDRNIQIDVCVYEFSGTIRRKSIEVDLNKDHIYVKKYHPAHCHTMEKRANNAKRLIDTEGSWWTSTGFIRNCIMINPE